MTHPTPSAARDAECRGAAVHHLPPRQPRDAAGQHGDRLPFSLKILLENLLRNEDDAFVKRADVEGG